MTLRITKVLFSNAFRLTWNGRILTRIRISQKFGEREVGVVF